MSFIKTLIEVCLFFPGIPHSPKQVYLQIQILPSRRAEIRSGQRLGSGDPQKVTVQRASQDVGLHHPQRVRQTCREESQGFAKRLCAGGHVGGQGFLQSDH